MATALRRLLALAFAGLLVTGTYTYAAERTPTALRHKRATVAKPALLLVPDVRGKAYVFAKGMLEEAGFAWRVTGVVGGYSPNTVVTQSPAPGIRVVDTGAPTIVLQLRGVKGYGQPGSPENVSPFPGTEVRLPGSGAGSAGNAGRVSGDS